MKNAPEIATTLHDRAIRLRELGRHTQSEALFRQALELRTQTLGSTHADVAQTMNFLANLLHQQGRNAEAEPLYGLSDLNYNNDSGTVD